eukprot:12387790-Alexandrium_andersonii.AAC.1
MSGFCRRKTADVDPTALKQALFLVREGAPLMLKYGIPGYMYSRTRFEDCPAPRELDDFVELMAALD